MWEMFVWQNDVHENKEYMFLMQKQTQYFSCSIISIVYFGDERLICVQTAT